MVSDKDHLLDRRGQCREDLALEDLAGLLHEDDVGFHSVKHIGIHSGRRSGAAYDTSLLEDGLPALGEQAVELFLDGVMLAR